MENTKMINNNDLQKLPNVGVTTEQKMKEGGILNIMAVAVCTPGQLSDIIGGTEAVARKIITAARDLCELDFEMATEVEKKEKSIQCIPTYCENIDALLGGGLELGTTMEVYSEFAGGKSCLAHLLAVSTIKNFPDSYVYFIDCENTFRTSRIRNFCVGLDVDPEHVLSHIKIGKALTSAHQILLTENIEKEIAKGLDVKLLIIDSLTNHFRAEYIGRGTLASRQQILNGYLHKIGKIADIYKIAVYLTNQVQADPSSMFGDPNRPIGGHILAHFATTRLYIRKCSKNVRKLILVDSPNLAPGEAIFNIETEKIVNGKFKGDNE